MPITKERAELEIAMVEKALAEGHAPPGMGAFGHNNTQIGAIHHVANLLKVPRPSLEYRIGFPDRPGVYFKEFGLQVDWSKYNPEPLEHVDQVELRRTKDALTGSKDVIRELERRVAAAEDLRSAVLGLKELPQVPVSFPRLRTGDPGAETVVLLLSDLHWSEVVDLNAMDGLNSYNLEIARKRLKRWTLKVIELLTVHWHSKSKPERIILILGGDLISGGIHFELAKTDALAPLPAVRDVADHLMAAIIKISTEVGVQIDIVSLPGNHARTTLKPESKEYARTSLDILVSDFLELGLRDRPGIYFYTPASPDALFSVYGWKILATHGDKVGSRGGQGFVGPAATAARGMKRVYADYAARGIILDLILFCHFHTPLHLEEGFVNGSLPGPSEYSRDARFKPHPALQLMFTVHPKHKHPLIRWIEVGDPSEGSLYEAPPPDRPLHQRFRIKAVTQKV
jgi:hypothetical protein